MVFKPFTHLARQNFSKAFTHGYAQSVVAASQSSYASSTTFNHLASNPSKFTRTNQLQNVFSNPSGSAAPGVKSSQANSGSGDFGLAAYYAAWQHAQQTGDDSDWKQLQRRRRIGRKPISSEEAEKNKDGNNVSAGSPHLTKASVNVDVSAKVEEAVAREIEIQEEQAKADELESKDGGDAASAETTEEAAVVSEESKAASDEIVQLLSAKKYVEIPAAFESALKKNLTPTVDAYNALLVAAVQLHVDVSQAVAKALDIYSDMLRRRVLPDEKTYTTLLELLATRANEAIEAKEVLEQERIRYGGMEEPGRFMLQSREMERDILAEDHSLAIAVKLFDTSTSRHTSLVFPLYVYRCLIKACAKEGHVEDMIRIYAHMETNKVTPHASIFSPMIDAFAATGDLTSAVECYNEYRSLAVSDDNGVLSVVSRMDGQVYAALIRAYLTCGKEKGAERFLEKVHESFASVENGESRREMVESVIVDEALVQHSLNNGEFGKALEHARNKLRQGGALDHAMARICVTTADVGNFRIASEAYDQLPSEIGVRQQPALAMVALCVRQGNLDAARPFWVLLSSVGQATSEMIQPTTMYSVALVKSGQIDSGLTEARNMFARIRSATSAGAQQLHVREHINESLHLLGRVLIQTAAVLSPQAAMALIWSMIDNGGLVSPIAEHAVASLGPMAISQLGPHDLALALRIQAGMLLNHQSMLFDVAHPIRFTHMLDVALSTALPMDAITTHIVNLAVSKLFFNRPDMVKRWQDHVVATAKSPYLIDRRSSLSPSSLSGSTLSGSPLSGSTAISPPPSQDTFDPYAYATDFRGSAIIADELENTSGRSDVHLNEALARFKSMRRVGRHPRYITYAKLITAAAKHNRVDLAHEILDLARRDVPLIPQHNAVKYGWVSILDAMVAACLTFGNRNVAATYHQELLDIGAAPSANTFGLYITTLKESTKTFDEATEALKIFHRAVAEGVEPTSFLYNALIGKLGKARRIDDCLLYFAEMRANNIRPTSVTYGTIVNALCRVSDERFAEEMFEEMESMPNYKPRAAPYNSIIQYFLNTKRDRSKVLAYYKRMQSRNIQPTMHTYKLLIDSYASLEPVDMVAAEQVLNSIKATGQHPEAVHYASLVHARGCVLHDMPSAQKVFESAVSNRNVRLQPCLYQALFEAMVANHRVADTSQYLTDMANRRVELTAYIANTLIHGWAAEGKIENAKVIYDSIGIEKREPSTYEAMTRAFLASEDHVGASRVVQEMLSRGYPAAVASKILDLVGVGTPVAVL